MHTQPRLDARAAGIARARPRHGLLGVMQSLYDEMLPGIADRQAAYAREVAAALSDVADVEVAPPVKEREDAERAMADLSARNLDGLLVVMLTYGPAMRVARISCCSLMPSHLAQYCIECQLRTSTAAVSFTPTSAVTFTDGRVM